MIKEEFSVFVPSYNQIQVPFSQDDNTIDILYRAAPIALTTMIVDPATTWVPIPPQLVSALINYTLHKIHSSIGGKESLAGMYFNKYEASIVLVKHTGLSPVENNLNEKLDTNGWV